MNTFKISAGAVVAIILVKEEEAVHLVPVLGGEEVDLGQDCQFQELRDIILAYKDAMRERDDKIYELGKLLNYKIIIILYSFRGTHSNI